MFYLSESEIETTQRDSYGRPATNLGEIFDAELDSEYHNYMSTSFIDDRDELISEQINKAKELGIQMENPFSHNGSYDEFGAETVGLQTEEDRVETFNSTAAANSFLTTDEIKQQVTDNAKRLRENARDITSRAESGFAKFVGAGGAGVTAAIQDPVNIGFALLSAPVAIEGLIPFMIFEGIVGATSEGIIQTAVVPYLEEQGVSHEKAMDEAKMRIGSGFVGGAAFAGLIKGAGKGISAVRKKFFNDETSIRQLVNDLEPHQSRMNSEQQQHYNHLRTVVEIEDAFPTPTGRRPSTAEMDEHIALVEAGVQSVARGEVSPALVGGYPKELDDQFSNVINSTITDEAFASEIQKAVAKHLGKADDNATRLLGDVTDDVDTALARAETDAGILRGTIDAADPTKASLAVRMKDGRILWDSQATTGNEVAKGNGALLREIDEVGFIADGKFFKRKGLAQKAAAKAVDRDDVTIPRMQFQHPTPARRINIREEEVAPELNIYAQQANAQRAVDGEFDDLAEAEARQIANDTDAEIIIGFEDGVPVTQRAADVLNEIDNEIEGLKSLRGCFLT